MERFVGGQIHFVAKVKDRPSTRWAQGTQYNPFGIIIKIGEQEVFVPWSNISSIVAP